MDPALELPSNSAESANVLQASDAAFDFKSRVLWGLRRTHRARPEGDAALGSESLLSSLTESDGLSDAPHPSPTPPYKLAPTDRTSSPAPSAPPAPAAPIAQTQQPPTRAQKRRAKKKELGHQNARQKKVQAAGSNPPPTLKKLSTSTRTASSFSASKFSIAKTGYIGRRSPGSPGVAYSLEELVGQGSPFGFKLCPYQEGIPTLITDENDLIIGIICGAPSGDPTWKDVRQEAARILEESRPQLFFKDGQKNHRRGVYSAISVGVSHGGGQRYPKALAQPPQNTEVIDQIMQSNAFQRMSGFASRSFATWAPRLHRHQGDYLSRLIAHDQALRNSGTHPRPLDPELHRNWCGSPWAASTLNFGPQTIAFEHADYGNLAFGMCAITALGDFDYAKGGHLVLWDLKLVIEFPPGTTILIPSSAISHSNTTIQPGERRYSVTQYSAGGIFRWVDNGFQKASSWLRPMGPDDKKRALETLSSQLDFGLSLYSTVSELQAEAQRRSKRQKTTA